MSNGAHTAGNGFNPADFARNAHPRQGGDEKATPADIDSDSAGRWDKHQQFSVMLDLVDGVQGVEYSKLEGAIFRDHDATLIRFTFHGIFYDRGKPVDSVWEAEIKGQRLETIHEHLCAGRRVSIKVNGSGTAAPTPMVPSITVRKIGK